MVAESVAKTAILSVENKEIILGYPANICRSRWICVLLQT